MRHETSVMANSVFIMFSVDFSTQMRVRYKPLISESEYQNKMPAGRVTRREGVYARIGFCFTGKEFTYFASVSTLTAIENFSTSNWESVHTITEDGRWVL